MFRTKSEVDKHVGRMLMRAKTDSDVCISFLPITYLNTGKMHLILFIFKTKEK